MKHGRMYWDEPANGETAAEQRLHVVSCAATPRPKWGLLYVALGMIALAGTAVHLLVKGPVLLEVADAAFTFALFATLVGWIHVNRVALTLADEAAASAGRPQLRVVRSRARSVEETYAEDGVVRLTPDEHVMLPYDFR